MEANRGAIISEYPGPVERAIRIQSRWSSVGSLICSSSSK